MNVYKGDSRRQVGGGLFSTVMRGAKPLLLSLMARVKPHFLKATEAVGKRAAKAAVNVGTGLASDMLLGKLNKRKAKDILNSEINELRTDANNFIENYKQNYVSQEGSGKRKRLSEKPIPKPKESKKMPKSKSINKRTCGSKTNKKKLQSY